MQKLNIRNTSSPPVEHHLCGLKDATYRPHFQNTPQAYAYKLNDGEGAHIIYRRLELFLHLRSEGGATASEKAVRTITMIHAALYCHAFSWPTFLRVF